MIKVNKNNMLQITKNSRKGELFCFYRYAINRIINAGKAGQYYATIDMGKLSTNKYNYFENMLKSRGFTINEYSSFDGSLIVEWN